MDNDATAVRDALTALDNAFARRDLQAALDLCMEDVVFVGSGQGEEAVGRDEIGPMFAALAPQLEGMEFSRGNPSRSRCSGCRCHLCLRASDVGDLAPRRRAVALAHPPRLRTRRVVGQRDSTAQG